MQHGECAVMFTASAICDVDRGGAEAIYNPAYGLRDLLFYVKAVQGSISNSNTNSSVLEKGLIYLLATWRQRLWSMQSGRICQQTRMLIL